MKKTIGSKILAVAVAVTVMFSCSFVTTFADTNVATVDGIGYATLQEAVDNANGKTVKLEKNVTECVKIKNGNITIDLNGNTLTGTGAEADTIYVAKGANLTVKGQGKVEGVAGGYAAIFNNGTTTLSGGHFTQSNSGGWYTILNHGNMTINEGVTVDAKKETSSSLVENGYYTYVGTNERSNFVSGTNEAKPSLTINGGQFTAAGYNAVKNDEGGALEINGGTFKSTYASGSAVINWNEATINGGTFTAAEDAVGVISNGSYGDHAKGTATVNGGKFIAESGQVFAEGQYSFVGGSFDVKGGEFVGPLENVRERPYKIVVTSGTFTDKVPTEILSESASSASLSSGDNTKFYIGTDAEISAKIKAEAKAGDTVTVFKGKSIEVPESVVVKNETGNDITVNDEPVADGGTVTAKDPDPETPQDKPENPQDKPENKPSTDKPTTDDKKTESPKTGDNTMVMGYAIIMLAALGIGGTLAVSKRKN